MAFSSRRISGSCFSIGSAIALGIGLAGCGIGSEELDGVGKCDHYAPAAESPYRLPFPAGVSYEVTQGNCESVTHWGRLRYAYDFAFNEGDVITAIRSGTVIHVNSAPFSTCLGNHVYIRHEDGTIARYLHFKDDTITVKIGAIVAQGDPLGGAGATGCTGKFVHLHLDLVNRDSDFQSLPLNFSNVDGKPPRLASRRAYTAR